MNILEYIKNDMITYWRSRYDKSENFHNIDVNYRIKFLEKEYCVCLQNGHWCVGNDHRRLSNELIYFREHSHDFLNSVHEFFGDFGYTVDNYKSSNHSNDEEVIWIAEALENNDFTIEKAFELYNILMKSMCVFELKVEQAIEYIESNNDLDKLEQSRIDSDFENDFIVASELPLNVTQGEC